MIAVDKTNNFLYKNINAMLIILVLVLTTFAYQIGLNGSYIFDDSANLKNINVFASFEGIEAYIRYILSSEAGFLKRPITTLSFLLNSTIWPVDAYYFKLTNLIIHLINGLLLYAVVYKLLTVLNIHKNKASLIAILNMSLWLLNPFLFQPPYM